MSQRDLTTLQLLCVECPSQVQLGLIADPREGIIWDTLDQWYQIQCHEVLEHQKQCSEELGAESHTG